MVVRQSRSGSTYRSFNLAVSSQRGSTYASVVRNFVETRKNHRNVNRLTRERSHHGTFTTSGEPHSYLNLLLTNTLAPAAGGHDKPPRPSARDCDTPNSGRTKDVRPVASWRSPSASTACDWHHRCLARRTAELQLVSSDTRYFGRAAVRRDQDSRPLRSANERTSLA